MKKHTVLLIGFGNPGRLDDALGPALAGEVESAELPGLVVESNYQLGVEDAAQIAEFDAVVFADASVNCTAPFNFYQVEPEKDGVGFSTHSVKPGALLGLAEDLFGKCPEAYMLAIRGYEFNEFGERLSEGAKSNLAAAVAFVKKLLRDCNSGELSFRDHLTVDNVTVDSSSSAVDAGENG